MPAGLTTCGGGVATTDCVVIVLVTGASVWMLMSGGGTKGGGGLTISGGGGGGSFSAGGGVSSTFAINSDGSFCIICWARPVIKAQITMTWIATTTMMPKARLGVAWAVDDRTSVCRGCSMVSD